MSNRIALIAAFSVFAAAAPALAGPWDAPKALCAEALAAEAGVEAADHDVTLHKARDGSVKRLTVSLSSKNGGATITGECRVRGNEVTMVKINA